MAIIRFNIDKGKLIYNNEGNYLYKATHDKIINRIHESLDLSSLKIKEPISYCVVYKNNQFLILNNIVLKTITDEVVHNHLIEYSEHKKIIDTLEKDIFGNCLSY